MEDTFILCPDDENRMLDPIDTFFYDLSGRVGWSLALAASFLLIFWLIHQYLCLCISLA
jgi:hypothetical protein